MTNYMDESGKYVGPVPALPPRNHNNPPDPIDEAVAPFSDAIAESDNWLDGSEVESLGQMEAVDALAKQVLAARGAVDKARDTYTKPLHEAWKAEVARWKPTQDDLEARQKGLAKISNAFKLREKDKRDAEQAEADRIAKEAARAAHEAAMALDEANIESVHEAARATREAEEAAKQLRQATSAAGEIKRLRTVTETVVVDQFALAKWLWLNDNAALLQWQADRAKSLGLDIPGVVEKRSRKEAY